MYIRNPNSGSTSQSGQTLASPNAPTNPVNLSFKYRLCGKGNAGYDAISSFNGSISGIPASLMYPNFLNNTGNNQIVYMNSDNTTNVSGQNFTCNEYHNVYSNNFHLSPSNQFYDGGNYTLRTCKNQVINLEGNTLVPFAFNPLSNPTSMDIDGIYMWTIYKYDISGNLISTEYYEELEQDIDGHFTAPNNYFGSAVSNLKCFFSYSLSQTFYNNQTVKLKQKGIQIEIETSSNLSKIVVDYRFLQEINESIEPSHINPNLGDAHASEFDKVNLSATFIIHDIDLDFNLTQEACTEIKLTNKSSLGYAAGTPVSLMQCLSEYNRSISVVSQPLQYYFIGNPSTNSFYSPINSFNSLVNNYNSPTNNLFSGMNFQVFGSGSYFVPTVMMNAFAQLNYDQPPDVGGDYYEINDFCYFEKEEIITVDQTKPSITEPDNKNICTTDFNPDYTFTPSFSLPITYNGKGPSISVTINNVTLTSTGASIIIPRSYFSMGTNYLSLRVTLSTGCFAEKNLKWVLNTGLAASIAPMNPTYHLNAPIQLTGNCNFHPPVGTPSMSPSFSWSPIPTGATVANNVSNHSTTLSNWFSPPKIGQN